MGRNLDKLSLCEFSVDLQLNIREYRPVLSCRWQNMQELTTTTLSDTENPLTKCIHLTARGFE